MSSDLLEELRGLVTALREHGVVPSDAAKVAAAFDECAARIEALEAENARLRSLVQKAYHEGFGEGMREHSTSRGGKDWHESRASADLKGQSDD